jgi:hypothetical protein
MGEIRSVDLRGLVARAGPVEFLEASWREDSVLALVRVSKNGHEISGSLRVDLDKRVFLDIPDTPDVEERELRNRAREIAKIVAERRIPSPTVSWLSHLVAVFGRKPH